MITKEELLPLLQDPDVSRIIHDYADVDLGTNSLHHTVGPGNGQVLAGTSTFDFSDFTQYPFTPNAPTGINVTSNIITTNDGNKLAEVIVTWTPVTANTDGTSVTTDELDSYLVSWRIAGVGDWTPEFSVDPTGNVAYFFGLKPGTTIDVRVAAVNLAQNKSAYGFAFAVVVGADLTPPNQPSVPVVTSLFGAIRVQWDGKDSLGAIMALDFDHVDVHVGTVSTFVPDDTNKVDSIPTLNGGAVVLSYTDYGTNHYIKFTALDKSGNRSTASAASSAVAARQGVNADFQDISATKILTGKLSVDVGLGGRFLIGPLNPDGTLVSPLGARMELRNDGVHIYNSSNVEVATMAIISGVPQINISGPIISGGTITGATVQTAGGGKRIILNGSTDTIELWSSGGYSGEIEGLVANQIAIVGGGGAEIDIDNQVTIWGNLILTGPPASNLTVTGTSTFNGSVSAGAGLSAFGITTTNGILVSSGAMIHQGTLNAIAGTGLNVNGSGVFQKDTSSLKYKTDVVVLDKTRLLELEPRQFKWKADRSKTSWGLIAEEVDALGLTPLVHYNEDGEPDGLDYNGISAGLLLEIKNLGKRVSVLEKA